MNLHSHLQAVLEKSGTCKGLNRSREETGGSEHVAVAYNPPDLSSMCLCVCVCVVKALCLFQHLLFPVEARESDEEQLVCVKTLLLRTFCSCWLKSRD